MYLQQARIINFRSLREVTVEFGAHTAFIGGNGAGKSSVLRALERFYNSSSKLEADDHFGRDRSQPVEIELTFAELSPEAKELFDTRVRNDRLTIARVFDDGPNSGRYHGSVPTTAEFVDIRKLSSASSKRAAYKILRESHSKYAGLPNVTSAAQVDDAMVKWEAEHPAELALFRDDGQFFGFQNAGRGALQRFTSLVFVPAVRDAAVDAADAKASPIGRLLEVLVRSAVLRRQDIANFRDATNARFRELTSPENMPELGALAGQLTSDLRQLYADAAVGLSWRQAAELAVPLPAADVTLSDDGFGGPVDRQGHGLQRAFIFTLLQQLARASTRSSDGGAAENDDSVARPPHKYLAPSLILAIEEPELYQHPTKQRHFAAVLRRLSNRSLPGAEGRTQVAFASHSPMFVSLPNVSEIRFLRRSISQVPTSSTVNSDPLTSQQSPQNWP